jgi:hypothetical protein
MFFSFTWSASRPTWGTMSSDDLLSIVRRLPIRVPDMRETLFAALTSHSGKLSAAIERLENAPSDTSIKAEATKHCGAAILILAAIAENHKLSLEDAMRAGEQVLR